MTFALAFTKIALKISASSLSSSLGGTYSVDIFGCLKIRELKHVYIFAAKIFPICRSKHGTYEYLNGTLHNVKTSFHRVSVEEFTKDGNTYLCMFLVDI